MVFQNPGFRINRGANMVVGALFEGDHFWNPENYTRVMRIYNNFFLRALVGVGGGGGGGLGAACPPAVKHLLL